MGPISLESLGGITHWSLYFRFNYVRSYCVLSHGGPYVCVLHYLKLRCVTAVVNCV